MPRKKSTKKSKTVKGTKKTAKKAPKKTSKKASKMQSMSQTHGKVEPFEPTTLDQIWGDDGSSKYKTINEDEYEVQIRSMNTTDLQMHATQVGLIPIQNRDLLQRRLLKEFKKHWASYKKPRSRKNITNLPQSVKDILAEGK